MLRLRRENLGDLACWLRTVWILMCIASILYMVSRHAKWTFVNWQLPFLPGLAIFVFGWILVSSVDAYSVGWFQLARAYRS